LTNELFEAFAPVAIVSLDGSKVKIDVRDECPPVSWTSVVGDASVAFVHLNSNIDYHVCTSPM
jgi:hypothetical protein